MMRGLVCLSLLLLCPFPTPGAGEVVILEEGAQLEFADSLLSQGHFFKAILEYERFLFFFPTSLRVDEATFRIGQAYDHAGRHVEAGSVYRRFISANPAAPLTPEFRLALGRSLALRHRYEDARRELAILAEAEPPLSASGRAALLHGLTYLPGDGFESAARSFAWTAERFAEEPVGELARELERLAARREEIPTLSPVLNGFLSAVVPGLGQTIAGRPADGLTALLTNALWIGGTVWAALEDEIPTAVICGILGVTFYVGNIYNAGEAAVELNRRRTAQLTALIVSRVRDWEAEHEDQISLAP